MVESTRNYLILIVDQVEFYWLKVNDLATLQVVILKWDPFELSWVTEGCDQNLPLMGIPERADFMKIQ